MLIKLLKNPRTVIAALGLSGALGVGSTFIKENEGVSLDAYMDSVGVPTICYGSTKGIQLGQHYTAEQCEDLLKKDMLEHSRLVWADVDPSTVSLGVFISVVDFTYNVGVQNYRTSTLRRHLRAGDYEAVCMEFPRWKYAGGKDCSLQESNCKGVWTRRMDEQAMCRSGLP